MKCKLCLDDKELCKSHIIPELLYKYGYDTKHRIIQMRIKPHVTNFIQKGYYEKLLCKDCENKLSKFETYFVNQWNAKLPDKINESAYKVTGLDYTKFKLFHLSILWRASISANAFFNQISLGPHEEKIRKMLLTQDPGAGQQYHFFAVVIVNDDVPVKGLIIEPLRSRYKDHWVYMFTFGGCMWHYFVSGHYPQEMLNSCFSEKGELLLVKEELSNNQYINDFNNRYRNTK